MTGYGTSVDDEKELLERVATGDERAFRTIYDRYSKKVFYFANHILNSDVLAEEVMQVVMLKLWQMGPELAIINNLEAYLNTASRNSCYNVLRRLKLEHKASDDLAKDWTENHNDTEELILLNETKKLVQDGLNAMPAYQRQVYELCYQQGLKYEEAAEKLGLSVNSVQTYMKLALRFLRHYIRTHTDVAALLIILKLF